MADPNPLDEVAFIKITHYANGTLSVSGMIGDEAYALRLLAQAVDAIKAQHKPRPLILLPNRDVDVPAYKHDAKPLGDMPRADWGDR